MIYNSSLIIPNLCPLQFKQVAYGTEEVHYPRAFNYVQKFGLSDTIHVQLHFASDPTANSVVLNAMDYQKESPVWDGVTALVYTATYTLLANGDYYGDYYIPCNKLSGVVYFTITYSGGLMAYSLPIEIGATQDTIQLTAHHTRNEFNTFFGAFQLDHLFTIRVEGGFKPDDFELRSDEEYFTNQSQEDTLTYSSPYDVEYCTLGDANGLPRWMAQKINAYLACDTLLYDNMQRTKVGEIELSDGVDMKKILRIGTKTTTNRNTQTMVGGIYLTNEEAVLLTDELEQILEI